MKRIITAVLAIVLCTATFAQTDRELTDTQEITVNYGQVTVPQFVYSMAYAIGTIFSFGQLSMDEIKFKGAFGVEYHYWLNDRFTVGGMFNLDKMVGYRNKEDGTVDHFSMNVCSLAAASKISWFNHEHFGMYSKLAIGVSRYIVDIDNSWAPAFQLTPVGCDFGGDTLRGVVELGVGNQGVALIGLKYNF